MNHGLALSVSNLAKRFSGAHVFSPLTFDLASGESLAITGHNGSGKSTLLKLLSYQLSATKGKCEWREGTTLLPPDSFRRHIGFVAPYLSLYNELTAKEHIEFVARLRNIVISKEEISAVLLKFGSDKTIGESRIVRDLSSGMQQRVRCAIAFALAPKVLFLDEPTSNLDEDGILFFEEAIREEKRRGTTVLIASNDPREITLAERRIHLNATELNSQFA